MRKDILACFELTCQNFTSATQVSTEALSLCNVH